MKSYFERPLLPFTGHIDVSHYGQEAALVDADEATHGLL